MEVQFVLKFLHILSATLLFGTGLGTAFHCWFAHVTGDARAIAVVLRNVVRADWLFTATSGIAQPVTGYLLIQETGRELTEPWIVLSFALYLIAGACWLVVVSLQMRARDLAIAAAKNGQKLPPDYYRVMRLWFALGWPAFLALIGIFWLMVSKPDLW